MMKTIDEKIRTAKDILHWAKKNKMTIDIIFIEAELNRLAKIKLPNVNKPHSK